MLNIFRILADAAHAASTFILINKITTSKSVEGISLKTQVMYVVVYLTRYLDLLYAPWDSFYNVFYKFFYLGSSLYILWLMMYKYRPSHNANIDTFKTRYLYGGAAVFALILNLKFTPEEIIWAYSIWLESVAIMPQLFMLQRTGSAQSLTVHYIFALGIYRALYILNWIYKWITGSRNDYVSVIAGLIQTALYSDFFWVYYQKVMKGQKFELPQ